MTGADASGKVLLDLNNPTFQDNPFAMRKLERYAAIATLNKRHGGAH